MPASPLPSFVVLYAAMFAAFGVASPFLPAFVNARGIAPEELGVVLAAGTAVRLVTAPLAGRLGDLLGALRWVLAVACALAACIALGYLKAQGFWQFFAVALLHAAALAPITVLADALALSAASGRASPGFEYGWVRGTGSAVFIAGTLLSGQAIGAWGPGTIVWLQAGFLVAAAAMALRVPEPAGAVAPSLRAPAGAVLVLLRLPRFRHVVLAAALVLGSHAMHDAFAMIRWREAGVQAGAASVLWSLAVAAEVLVFFFAGPALIRRIGPAAAIGLAAMAGALRWAVMAQSADIVALALVQPLHGVTFALLHLACMRLIASSVPHGLEGTGQALYAAVGVGAATALLTLASGALYARLGAHGFWVMAALCASALPVAWRLRTAARTIE